MLSRINEGAINIQSAIKNTFRVKWHFVDSRAISQKRTMAEQTEFQKRLQLIGVNGMISAAIALGNRLHLFEALANVGSERSCYPQDKREVPSDCKDR
ncbi:hypothetical protein OSTOST_22632 [Ostertagia ostertagi]